MVFFNYATMQMAAKIVYYGPGLCGKTTNLHVIYGRTAPTSRGEMVCLETETDRTLFFDLLPLDVGIIGGFKTRLQLYTVPGQVFYNTTRKLVLKGVDGIVFVADSQRPMRDPNVESLKNLRENLAEIGLDLSAVPRVFQYNKRDLPNILSIEELNESLNPDGSVEWHEASATNGTGVFETLKAISKLTLRSLKGRMTVEQRRPSVVVSAETPAPIPAAALHTSGITAAVESIGTASAVAEPPKRDPFDSTISRLQRLSSLARQGVDLQAAHASGASLDSLSPRPPAEGSARAADGAAQEAPFEAANTPVEDSGGEVSFAEIQPPPDEPPPNSSVKHVRVRSNVDILSELEKLRKIATQRPVAAGQGGKIKSAADVSLDDLLGSTRNNKKDVAQSFEVLVPKDLLSKSRRVTVALSFGDGSGAPVGAEKRFDVELAGAKDLQKLLLSLKFNVRGE
jgi:mutual gliding-motility protein MglA